MRNEDGVNAGSRNLGRLALWSIPLSLGLAATVWFGLYLSGWEFQQKKAEAQHELTQQERSAVYVGAAVRPKGKIAVEMKKDNCMPIVRADVDTKREKFTEDLVYSLIMYAQNQCGPPIQDPNYPGVHVFTKNDYDYMEWHWALVSPNGALLKSGYTNHDCQMPFRGETSECAFDVPADDRADRIKVWTLIR